MDNTPPPPDERPWRRREYSGAGSTLGLAALIVLVVGLAIWYLEFADTGDGGNADGDLGIVALATEANPTGESPAAREGRAAPNFRLRNLDGTEEELVDFRGKTVVLNFWASWCGPCRQETPVLQRMFEDHASDGVVVLGVNQQEREPEVRDFAEDFALTYPVLLDSSGEVSDAYSVGTGLPITFVVDPDGVIRRIHRIVIDDDDVGELLAMEP